MFFYDGYRTASFSGFCNVCMKILWSRGILCVGLFWIYQFGFFLSFYPVVRYQLVYNFGSSSWKRGCLVIWTGSRFRNLTLHLIHVCQLHQPPSILSIAYLPIRYVSSFLLFCIWPFAFLHQQPSYTPLLSALYALPLLLLAVSFVTLKCFDISEARRGCLWRGLLI